MLLCKRTKKRGDFKGVWYVSDNKEVLVFLNHLAVQATFDILHVLVKVTVSRMNFTTLIQSFTILRGQRNLYFIERFSCVEYVENQLCMVLVPIISAVAATTS